MVVDEIVVSRVAGLSRVDPDAVHIRVNRAVHLRLSHAVHIRVNRAVYPH